MTKSIETAEKPGPTLESQRSNTARWVKVARWGAIVVVAWSIVVQLLAGILIPPLAIIGVAFAVVAFFLRDERRVVGLVAAILALLAIVGNLPMAIDELSNPSSASAFIPTLLVMSTAAVIIIAGIAAFRGWSAQPARSLVSVAGGLVAAGIVFALVAATGVDSAQPQSSDIEVVASGVEFEPTQLTVAAGETGFWLDNQDAVRHTFSIRETDLEIDAPAFSSQRADFALEPGTYEVFCAVPGHENMRVELTVEG